MFSIFLTTGFWVLLAFLAFLFLFGKKIFSVSLSSIDDRIAEIRNLLHSVKKEKETLEERLKKREKDLQLVEKKCDELQKKAQVHIKDMISSQTEDLKLLERNMEISLEKNKKQLQEYFEKNAKKQAVALYEGMVVKQLTRLEEKNKTEYLKQVAEGIKKNEEG